MRLIAVTTLLLTVSAVSARCCFITLLFEGDGVVVVVTGQPAEADHQADHYGDDDCY